jgi:hypothetical protein
MSGRRPIRHSVTVVCSMPKQPSDGGTTNVECFMTLAFIASHTVNRWGAFPYVPRGNFVEISCFSGPET